MIGQVLGSYRVLSQLGAGGMGTVWLAEHQLLGSRAAIKVLLPEMSGQRKVVQRFFDEARAATRIQDTGIITVLDFGWHEGCAYLVMELLVGETLADRLKRVDRLPVVQAARLIQQCALAMAAAHASGIVHRDLKPDNLFVVTDPAVTGGERIKILDFGIAKLIDSADASHSRTQTGVIMGTPAFMSPEQCRGAGGLDHRTDVYALGCVLFNVLCGRPPFIAGTPGDMIVAHLQQVPPVPSAFVPGLPADLDEIVARCLAKDADERFQTMTELARAVGVLTGDHLSLGTIPPMRASYREPATDPEVRSETVETHAGVPNTTLRGSTGEASLMDEPERSRRGWLFLAVPALAALGVIAFVTTRRSAEVPAPPASVQASAVDAGVVEAAAAVDAAVTVTSSPATHTQPTRPSATTPARPRSTNRASAPSHAKDPPRSGSDAGVTRPSGSAAPRSGSATPDAAGSAKRPFDPYEVR